MPRSSTDRLVVAAEGDGCDLDALDFVAVAGVKVGTFDAVTTVIESDFG